MKTPTADRRTAWRSAVALSLMLALALLARPAAASQAPTAPDTAAETAPDSPADTAGLPSDDWKLCSTEISKVEAAEQIPSLLLHAISKIESGRTSPEGTARIAWPWTVMAEGQGRYLPTKAAAIAEVKKLRKRGVKSIDVGCMQVNLMYHADAFDSVEDAFDPAQNVAYAAQFLKALKDELHSWIKAVGSYHSRTPAYFAVYRSKVFAAWRQEQKNQRADVRDELVAAKEGRIENLAFRHAGPVAALVAAFNE
ncbi:lytic transglycosylase domain-containing protein [Hypericibacter sp.]|uniref:lytic transglycosylase domain-containing protein n=1 Tax=Hypericibacter sp. TaxID=2705401 RepID=UPI003D6CBA60